MADRPDSLPGTNGRRRIYLMRHGEVRYFRDDGSPVDPDLVEPTETGRAQAEAAARLLAEVPLDRVLHTGLARTRQTAGIVAAAHDLEAEEAEAFREIRPGRLQGAERSEIESEFVYGMERAAEPGIRFSGGEPYAGFYARVTRAFERLLLEPGWRRLLLVAHDGTNRMLLGWTCRGGLAAVGAFEQDPGCINIVDCDVVDGRVVRRLVKALNLTPTNWPKHGNYLTSIEQVFWAGRPSREA